MRFTDFITELEKAGWRDTSDSQHKNIEYLHRKLFPVIAELEADVITLEQYIDRADQQNRG